MKILLLQAAPPAEKFLYADNKINTVIIVLVLIMLGIAMYLFRMDRKISRLEKNMTESQPQNRNTGHRA